MKAKVFPGSVSGHPAADVPAEDRTDKQIESLVVDYYNLAMKEARLTADRYKFITTEDALSCAAERLLYLSRWYCRSKTEMRFATAVIAFVRQAVRDWAKRQYGKGAHLHDVTDFGDADSAPAEAVSKAVSPAGSKSDGYYESVESDMFKWLRSYGINEGM